MTPDAQPTREPVASPGRKPSERFRDCADLLGLLADELEALEQEDFPKLRELSSLRARLEGELREEGEAELPLLRVLEERIGAVLGRLEAWAEHDRSTRSQLSELQEGSLSLVRGIGGLPRGRYPAAEPGSGKLDLRF